MIVYIDRKTGNYLLPTRETYKHHIYCRVYRRDLFDPARALYMHSAYIAPDRIDFDPVDIMPDYILKGGDLIESN